MRKLDLTGQTFGRWTVLKLLTTRSNLRYWLCRCSCGKDGEVTTGNLRCGYSKSCGCLRMDVASAQPKGKNSPSWKGGVQYDQFGYKLVHNPQHHRAKGNGYVREHIAVMETKLGRKLVKGENVHHINGVKDDNRPENLELWVVSQPPGQRPQDLVKWATEIMERYGRQIGNDEGASG